MILVTGATGRVGAAVLDLLPPELAIRAGVRNPDKVKDKLAHLNYCHFDMEKPESFVPALEGVQKVFLMWPPVKVDFVYQFIEAAEKAGVQHIVFLSIIVADKLEFLPHRRIEKRLEASSIAYTFLRASYFMQNLDTIHRADIQESDVIFIPAGNGKLNLVDVRDVAAVAVKALTETGHENKAYALSGKETLRLDEVAAIFTEVLGRKIRYSDPNILHFVYHMTRKRKLKFSLVMFMIIEYTAARFDLGAEIPSQFLEILGRENSGLRQYVEDYREMWM